MPADAQNFVDRSLLLDLETGPDGALLKIGAVRGDASFLRQGRFDRDRALAELDAFARGAERVLGHNLLGHDLPTLRAQAPFLQLLGLPVVDTLYLSPLAFPENPYHRLVKDYKLVRDAVNDPVADARLAARVLAEQWEELARRAAGSPADALALAVYRFCFRGATGLAGAAAGGSGLAAVFAALGAPAPDARAALEGLRRLWDGRTCAHAGPSQALRHLADPALRPAAAYATAWLLVAGGRSVLPPWVFRRFPETAKLLVALREAPCGDPACLWCADVHDPRRQLERWFGFPAFRAEPAAADGGSLQEAIAGHGMGGGSQLALLPTGGGKSLCFQLPALVRHLRRGVLTLVISPLQALMKDQVDNLARLTGTTAAAALYGMLTPPERGEVLERLRLGEIALLYVSPEQLRNRSFRQAIEAREIGCWVFDEAHCLSRWGHDFRPDYLYAGRFIRELAQRQGVPVPPVACFTATAKTEVVDEIRTYFRDRLGLDLRLFEGGVERTNLTFEVQTARVMEKDARVHAVLTEHLAAGGAAVVYAGTRKRVEELAEYLATQDWQVAAFHAGIPAPEKKRIQDAFVAGALRVICATNAFGMGVDKDDVRLVVHVDIPGSLENYVQEAGRAGRDGGPADCVLLYDEQDADAQFRMEARGELTREDIAEILRALRRARRGGAEEVIISSGELLRDEELRLGFDPGERDADTRVKIAVAWLERAGFVERNENQTRVFQGRPLVADLDEARRRVAGLGLSEAQRARWLAVMQALLESDPDEGLAADQLARLPQFEPAPGKPPWDRGERHGQRVLRTLHDMAQAGLLETGPQLTAFVRHGIKDSSDKILERVCALERSMLRALREEAPDAADGTWQLLSLRRLNQRLLDTGENSNPETLRRLLASLARDGRGLAADRASLEARPVERDQYQVRLHRDWTALTATAERRQAVAAVVLRTLLAKVPPGTVGKDLLVAFGTDELTAALRADVALAGAVRDPLAAVDRGLMFLHEQGAIVLQQGLAVFRQAMTVRILPEARGKRFGKGDFAPLAQHYGERVFQIHVMDEYARLGLRKIREAVGLVTAYFTLDKAAFVRRYFADRREILTRATTAESFRRVVDALGNPAQSAIVAAPEEGNRLVLAGPGSGKTRVVVHRCAYLLKVLRVDPRGVLVLCFNRAAALEIRRRLAALAGDDARGVTVQTYHGLAMRLTGCSFAERLERSADAPDLDDLIPRAVDLLEGRTEVPGMEPDLLRERLLAGWRHILVDEYQDIDADQYRLISAIAGRTREEGRLTLLAVGDDDQNIYGFRGANVEYIRRFQEDYAAELHHLVENYRSSGHIVAASNALIAANRDRMKTDHPIRVDRRRAADPPGGRWALLDPVGRGRVLVLETADPARQAAALVERMRTLRESGCGEWSGMAVLACQHRGLAPVRALCEAAGIPVARREELPPLHRVREVSAFLDALAAHGQTPVTAAGLAALVPATAGPWAVLLRQLCAAWADEAGEAEVPAARVREFCFETLAEQRRERSLGDGVLLATLHGAKGLEFPHVLIVDGGWPAHPGEDERRRLYVGMTPARETLTLGHLPAGNPFLGTLDGDWLTRLNPDIPAPPRDLLARRWTLLSPADLDLGFAGRLAPGHPVHAGLAALTAGDALVPRAEGERVLLCGSDGRPLARLSAQGSAHWLPRLDSVEEVRVIALIRRRREDGEAKYRDSCRCDTWEVPLVEVRWREGE